MVTSAILTGPNGGTAAGIDIRPEVLASIQKASLNTGVDFSYLMAQAARESSFDPAAAATTSSAKGLYQFVEQTWLAVFKKHGAEYGYGDLADKIKQGSDGRYTVSNAATRKEILGLRRNPELASAMAAEHASDNKEKIEAKLGRPATATDLYLAHFLGLSGALKFLRNAASSPDSTGASLFPKAAAANASIFYDDKGNAKTLKEIYASFDAKMNTDTALYANLETKAASGGATQMADLSAPVAGPGSVGQALHGFTRPGSVLSPFLMVTLAALPVGREGDGKDNAAERSTNSLFDKSRSAGNFAAKQTDYLS
jgi:hypothetical protein